jgi:hypothetical protein
MLHRLEIENFYSIRDPQIIDLRAAGNVPHEPWRLSPAWPGASERVPKVVALFGANASGKSNVLRALTFLSWFVADSGLAHPEDPMPFEPFYDDAAKDMPTRLAVYFAGPAQPDQSQRGTSGWSPSYVEGPLCRYMYEVSFGGPPGTPRQVLGETLRYWPPDAGRQVRLFERDHNGTVRAGRKFSLTGDHRREVESALRPNASVVSFLWSRRHLLSEYLYHVLGRDNYNIFTEKFESDDTFIANYYWRHQGHLKKLNDQIQRIDLGVREMRLRGSGGNPTAWFDHVGLTEPVPVKLESHGTRQFVRIFPHIVRALENGCLAVVDELDLSIHPLVLPEILRWFHDPEQNPENAQLWMTCQNASLLEDLSKEEVLFCEKDRRGRTKVYGLSDIQAVRRRDNYYRQYLSGVYGAIPRLG